MQIELVATLDYEITQKNPFFFSSPYLRRLKGPSSDYELLAQDFSPLYGWFMSPAGMPDGVRFTSNETDNRGGGDSCAAEPVREAGW